MNFLEIIIIAILSIFTIIALTIIYFALKSEHINPVPQMDNTAPKFCEVENVFIQEIFQYKVK